MHLATATTLFTLASSALAAITEFTKPYGGYQCGCNNKITWEVFVYAGEHVVLQLEDSTGKILGSQLVNPSDCSADMWFPSYESDDCKLRLVDPLIKVDLAIESIVIACLPEISLDGVNLDDPERIIDSTSAREKSNGENDGKYHQGGDTKAVEYGQSSLVESLLTGDPETLVGDLGTVESQLVDGPSELDGLGVVDSLSKGNLVKVESQQKGGPAKVDVLLKGDPVKVEGQLTGKPRIDKRARVDNQKPRMDKADVTGFKRTGKVV